MTKKELIQSAYGDNYEKLKSQIDKNGYLNCGYCVNGSVDVVNYLSELEIDYYIGDYHNSDQYGEGFGYWRPKQLEGIETNNGWIRIESINDLPKDIDNYWVIWNNQIKNSINTTKAHFYYGTKTSKDEWMQRITHYQSIVIPKKPLY